LGSHADWIDPDDLIAFLEQAPDREFDCMLEAKKKDLALFRLREEMERVSVKT
jgi:UV DNA damage endonuclease